MSTLVDRFLHLDRHLAELVAAQGRCTYGVLFAVVFAETGLIVAPLLPGDSLLFATGALAAVGALDVRIASGVLVAAAIIGDAGNYAAGRFVGRRVFRAGDTQGIWHRALNRRHLLGGHDFFELPSVGR